MHRLHWNVSKMWLLCATNTYIANCAFEQCQFGFSVATHFKYRSVLLKGHFNGNVNSYLHSAILVSKNGARCLLHSVKFCSIKKLCDKSLEICLKKKPKYCHVETNYVTWMCKINRPLKSCSKKMDFVIVGRFQIWRRLYLKAI